MINKRPGGTLFASGHPGGAVLKGMSTQQDTLVPPTYEALEQEIYHWLDSTCETLVPPSGNVELEVACMFETE